MGLGLKIRNLFYFWKRSSFPTKCFQSQSIFYVYVHASTRITSGILHISFVFFSISSTIGNIPSELRSFASFINCRIQSTTSLRTFLKTQTQKEQECLTRFFGIEWLTKLPKQGGTPLGIINHDSLQCKNILFLNQIFSFFPKNLYQTLRTSVKWNAIKIKLTSNTEQKFCPQFSLNSNKVTKY